MFCSRSQDARPSESRPLRLSIIRVTWSGRSQMLDPWLCRNFFRSSALSVTRGEPARSKGGGANGKPRRSSRKPAAAFHKQDSGTVSERAFQLPLLPGHDASRGQLGETAQGPRPASLPGESGSLTYIVPHPSNSPGAPPQRRPTPKT
jgi:hypothetical protein